MADLKNRVVSGFMFPTVIEFDENLKFFFVSHERFNDLRKWALFFGVRFWVLKST
jgi:hypothetical protein